MIKMVVSADTLDQLTKLVLKYIPPDKLKAFAAELALVDGNKSVRETVTGLAKRLKGK